MIPIPDRIQFRVLFLVCILFFLSLKSIAQVSYTYHAIEDGFKLYFVRSADFDKDGDADILGGYNFVSWFENDGHGHFVRHDIAGTHILWSVYPADFDNDGDTDVVIAETNSISWCENKGDSFEKHRVKSNYYFAESVAAADFDKDGDMDIVGLRWGTNSDPEYDWAGLGKVNWWENDGHGNFTMHDLDNTFPHAHRLLVEDMDRDNDMDIVACGASSDGVTMWENLGGGNFDKKVVTHSGGLAIAAADIDQNNTIDLVYCLHSDGVVKLYLNNGSNSFTERKIADNLDWPGYACPGDFNNDGKTDILIVNQRSESEKDLVLLKNTGNLEFSPYVIQHHVTQPFSADVADFNHDGILDIATGSRYDQNVFWLEGKFPEPPKNITLTSPNGNEKIISGKSIEIQWTSFGDVGNVQIQFSADGGESWNPVTSSTSNDGSYIWQVPFLDSQQCLVRITEIESGYPTDTSDDYFTISTPKPFTLLEPNGGEVWYGGNVEQIRWDFLDTTSFVQLEYSADNGATWQSITEQTTNDGEYDWLVPEVRSESCFVKISNALNENIYDRSDTVFTLLFLNSDSYALHFDGVDDFAQIPDNEILSGGPGKSITVEAWIKLPELTGAAPVVIKFLDGNEKDWGLQLVGGVLQAVVETDGNNWECKGGQIPANEWTHVAFTFDNQIDLVKIFINGIEVGAKALDTDMPDTNAPIFIGRHSYYPDYFSGTIDEVQIWNYARTDTAILRTMYSVLTGTETGLIGYWRFDEGIGQVSYDLTGNSNNVLLGTTTQQDSEDPAWVESDAPLNSGYNEISISGIVTYFSNSQPIGNVVVELSGNPTMIDTTDVSGNFYFSPLKRNYSYSISPSEKLDKNGEFSITSYDAALAFRYALDLQSLSAYQQVAADVDKNQQVMVYDAAIIARFAVGLPQIPNTYPGNWVYNPDTLDFPQLSKDTSGVSVDAILLGDVDGSWNGTSLAKNFVKQDHLMQKFAADYVIQKGDTITLVFDLSKNKEILSFDTWLSYSPQDYEYLHYKIFPDGSKLNILSNHSEGDIRIGGYAMDYLDKDYHLQISFCQKTTHPLQPILIKRFIINNDVIIDHESIFTQVDNGKQLPKSFQLKQNYPNPFNTETAIEYSIPKSGHVKLNIYNMQGELIYVLKDENQLYGDHKVIWNARDQYGYKIPPGVYFVRVKFEGVLQKIIKICYLP